MKNRYIPAFIMLAAGLVCCVLCVVQRWPVLNSLITLVIVLLLFYIIGQIAAQIVGKVQAEHLAMIEAEKKRAGSSFEGAAGGGRKRKGRSRKTGGSDRTNGAGMT